MPLMGMALVTECIISYSQRRAFYRAAKVILPTKHYFQDRARYVVLKVGVS